jgi:hypothetical protein
MARNIYQNWHRLPFVVNIKPRSKPPWAFQLRCGVRSLVPSRSKGVTAPLLLFDLKKFFVPPHETEDAWLKLGVPSGHEP